MPKVPQKPPQPRRKRVPGDEKGLGGIRNPDSPHAWKPTDEQRRLARQMAAVGITTKQIALMFDICERTLLRHLQRELDQGGIEATARVAQNLYLMATVPPGQANSANVTAMIFWLKCRAGWRDYKMPEMLDEHGIPISSDGRQTFVLTIER